MTDRGHDLARVEEAADDLDRLLLKAQLVGIDLPSGQNEGVVLGDIHVFEVLVDRDRLAPVVLVPAVYFSALPPRLRRRHLDLCAGVLELLLRDEKFGLLEAVRRDDEDPGLFDVRHGVPPKRVGILLEPTPPARRSLLSAGANR